MKEISVSQYEGYAYS